MIKWISGTHLKNRVDELKNEILWKHFALVLILIVLSGYNFACVTAVEKEVFWSAWTYLKKCVVDTVSALDAGQLGTRASVGPVMTELSVA